MSVATLFDYDVLDIETRIVVQQKTGEIRERIKRTAQDLIEIGERVTDIKSRLGHGRFIAWLNAEFQWSERTAQNLMAVAQAFKSANFADLAIEPSALYALASPSVPAAARQEAIQSAQDGARVTHSAAKEIIGRHRPAAQSSTSRPAHKEEVVPVLFKDDDGNVIRTGSVTRVVPLERETGHVVYVGRSEPSAHNGSPKQIATTAAHVESGPLADEDLDEEPGLVLSAEAESDKWADRWNKMIDNINLFLVSLPRRGGIIQLTKNWTPLKKSGAIENLKSLRRTVDQCIKELEGPRK